MNGLIAYLINCGDYQDLSLVEIGRQKCSPLYSFGPFVRNEYIFHYVISGCGYFSCSYPEEKKTSLKDSLQRGEGIGQKVQAGEGFLIEPHLKHIYYADEADPWHYIWVVFKGLCAPQYLRACGLSKNNAIYRPKDYSVATMQKNRQHLQAILDQPHSDNSYIIGHFSLFFSDLIQNSANRHTELSPPSPPKSEAMAYYYLNQAVKYISENYCTIRSLDEIANFCNISRSHLGRLFRDNLHTSLQEYLISYRLNKARELLSGTSLPISEIAIQIGCQNELNLYRAFKKAYGMAPGQWRNCNTF